MINQTASLTWRDTDSGAVPVSDQFDDPYYSLNGGLDETLHVFINGNDLPDRFGGDLHVAELGFGTGLNFLVTWDAWQKAGGRGSLRFTSFEAFAMTKPDMRAALAAFPTIRPLAEHLLDRWDIGASGVEIARNVVLDVIIGDARETLPVWQGVADAWYLDGFSPAKNPALWEPALLGAVGAHTAEHGTVATYSAAGHVRMSLDAAGFDVSRVAGYGRKRHMTVGRLRDGQ